MSLMDSNVLLVLTFWLHYYVKMTWMKTNEWLGELVMLHRSLTNCMYDNVDNESTMVCELMTLFTGVVDSKQSKHALTWTTGKGEHLRILVTSAWGRKVRSKKKKVDEGRNRYNSYTSIHSQVWFIVFAFICCPYDSLEKLWAAKSPKVFVSVILLTYSKNDACSFYVI